MARSDPDAMERARVDTTRSGVMNGVHAVVAACLDGPDEITMPRREMSRIYFRNEGAVLPLVWGEDLEWSILFSS